MVVPHPPSQAPLDLPAGTRVTRVRRNGTIRRRGVHYMVSSRLAGQEVLVIDDGTTILIANLDGEVNRPRFSAAPIRVAVLG
jgi:hypothetical protein